MKTTLFLSVFLTLLLGPNYSKANGRILPDNYNVVSDKKDKSIKENTFILCGTVKMFSSNLPLDNVLVGCLSSASWVRSDDEGKFEVRLQSTDSLVYFYKQAWGEVVIDDYKFKSQHRVELEVWMNQEQSGNVKRKPVIYMYSDKLVKAKVKLDPKGDFTFTYPIYSEGWDVSVSADEGLKCKGKAYPYLFWEATSSNMNFNFENGKIPGFIVKTTEVVTFLEGKLQKLGFNAQEQTDFITYWGPLLAKKEYAFIQFLVDEEYDRIAKLDITPKPENCRRVYILCSSLDQKDIGVEVVPQSFSGFERNGFTVVEWGGTLMNLEQLTP